MNTTSAPGPILEVLGRVAYEAHLMRPLLPTYLHLIVSAIFPIWSAAHAALARPSSAAPREKKQKDRSSDEDGDEENDEETSPQVETFSATDALLFPVLAGITLTVLYFVLKWLQDPAWLNYILGLYFSQLGLFFAVKFIKDVLSFMRSTVFPTQYSSGGQLWKMSSDSHFETQRPDGQKLTITSPLPSFLGLLPLPRQVRKHIWNLRRLLYRKATLSLQIRGLISLKTPIDILDLFSLVLSTAIVYWHTFISKPWFLTNILGFSFCYGSLQYATPGTSSTGTLLLCGLFFYDIYMVFYTPMMVTVATKLDVPIKLLFPRPDGCLRPDGAVEGSEAMEEYLRCLAKKRTMAMLGLGDIVIPGMMLAFALRFDLYMFYLKMKSSGSSHPPTSSEQLDRKAGSKPIYIPVRGSWGERFWTNKSLWSKEIAAKAFPKPYFYATVIGYVTGMIATVFVMQVFQHAQPALLYLVPGVLISFWGTALIRGDVDKLWHYSEIQDEEPEKTSARDKKTEEKSETDRHKGETSKNSDHKKGDEDLIASSDEGSLEKITSMDAEPDLTSSSESDEPVPAKKTTLTDQRQSRKKNLPPSKEPKETNQTIKADVLQTSPRQLISFSITLPPKSTDADTSSTASKSTKSLQDFISKPKPPIDDSLINPSSTESNDNETAVSKTTKTSPHESHIPEIQVRLADGRTAILGKEDAKTLATLVEKMNKSDDFASDAGVGKVSDIVRVDGEPPDKKRRRKL